ncbi:hypothetical protein BLOT_011171 [Blomia tropicalis]|nr:hypothetical protein BLOT_011171 [Blomia tropicalis]
MSMTNTCLCDHLVSQSRLIQSRITKLESLFKGNISGILGTPLQIYLLLGAKGFIKNFIRWVNNTNSSFNFDCLGKDIVGVYENFIDNKYDIHVKKVNNSHNDDSDCEPKENFNQKNNT